MSVYVWPGRCMKKTPVFRLCVLFPTAVGKACQQQFPVNIARLLLYWFSLLGIGVGIEIESDPDTDTDSDPDFDFDQTAKTPA